MHGLNLCYAQYYNRKYKRHGHVFQGRFLSNVIDNDIYNLAVSSYIHANLKDFPHYRDTLHTYSFSSYGIYIGTAHDKYELIDTDFILSQFANNPKEARIKYAEFVSDFHQVTKKEKAYELIEAYTIKPEYTYESVRFIYSRDFKRKEIIAKVSDSLHIPNSEFIHIKYAHKTSHFKAIVIFLLRCLCNYTYKKICKIIGNITLSQVDKLSSRGFELIYNEKRYQNLLPTFLNC